MALTRPRIGQLITTAASLTDNITVINSAATLANVDVGFLFNRTDGVGSVPNVALYWNETLKSFTYAYTTDSDSVGFANINATSWANITVANITANGIYFPNGVSYASTITSGFTNYSNTNVAAYLTTASINTTGNIQAGNITTTGVSGNISNVSYILAASGIYSGNVQAGNIIVGAGLYFSNGSPYSTGTASVSGLNGQLQYNNNGVLAGANVAYFSANTTLIANANISSSANVSAANILTNNLLYANGQPYVFSTYSNTSVAAYLPTHTGNIQAGNITITGNLTVANIIYTNQEVITSTETVQGNLVAGSGVASTNTTTGALVVVGGAGISGALNVGGIVNSAGNIFAYVQNNAAASYVTSNVSGYQLAQTINTGLGSLAIGFGTNTQPGGFMTIAATGGKNSINAGSARDFYIQTSTGIQGLYITDANGNVTLNSTTTSTGNTTGALTVKGGVGVSGNIYGNSRIGFVYANSVSSVYTTFNQATASYDIVFG
jgi:hypothetical protein